MLHGMSVAELRRKVARREYNTMVLHNLDACYMAIMSTPTNLN